MRTFNLASLILISTTLLAACGQKTQTASTVAASGDHIQANHCEIFIDRLGARMSSHASEIITAYIKLLPSRLDGAVTEVGVRVQEETAAGIQYAWHNELLRKVADDYYVWEDMIYSGLTARQTDIAAFYVKTDKGTTYWHKNDQGGNFVFDSFAYDIISSQGTATGAFRIETATQKAALKYYNKDMCY